MGKVGVKLALTYKRQFPKSYHKRSLLVIILILIVNMLFTLFLVNYVAYNLLGKYLTDSVEGEIITKFYKGFR